MIRLLLFVVFFPVIALAQPVTAPDVRQNKANVFTKEQTISLSASNYQPGTTRHMKFLNPGSYSWLDFYFGSGSGSLKAAIGATNSGGLQDWITSGQCRHLQSLSGFGSASASECISGYDHNSGYISAYTSMKAGGTGTPSSVLEVQGTSEFKSEVVTSTGTLSTNATVILCNASTNACSGTPSNACSTYSTQVNCEARDSHGGCNWNVVDCSQWNYDETNCNANSGYGCSYQTASCSGAPDESSCLSQDDSYGGNCSWDNNPQSCSGFDESTCSMTSGCTVNYGYCSWDGMSCSGGGDCSSQSDESSCLSYTYYDSCSGSYDSYSCNGNYNTGSCIGSGGYCSGSPTCSGIDDSVNCSAETGCTWATSVTMTLPSLSSTYNGRWYWFKNITSSGADCIIQANTGQDVDGSSSLTLANYKDATQLLYHELTANCSAYSNNESSCSSTGGCSWSGCSQYSDEGSCTGSSYSCSWDGTNCTGSNGDCNGTYITAKRWHELSKRY